MVENILEGSEGWIKDGFRYKLYTLNFIYIKHKTI